MDRWDSIQTIACTKGDILIVRRKNSWFWMIPLADDKVSVGLVLDLNDFKELKQEPLAVFEDAVASTPARAMSSSAPSRRRCTREAV